MTQMVKGREKDGNQQLDSEGGGQSAGVPAAGELEGNSVSPFGNPGANPGMRHWQASYIESGSLNDRGNIFFAAVEMTRMPMLVTDPNLPDEPVVFVNRAFLDLTGYEESEVLGRNCRFLQGAETDPSTVAEVRSALKEQRAVAVDILNYKADGTPFWNALFIGPVFDKEGKLLFNFSSQMDITRRRVSEQSYLQAQKMEAIGQLTAGLAHDFNNLLQVVSGNLELAARALDANSLALQPIERAQRAAARAGKLTQELLTFARKQRLEPRQVNFNALVVDFSEMLVRTLGDTVELQLDLKPGLPQCLVDPTHLEMALLNVLINARDAMPEGGKVTVATSVISDPSQVMAHGLAPGNYVVLRVRDEGQGMQRDVLRRATEPFFTTKGPGTGLGLAMVHGFVQQSNGRLEIDSAPGVGTTVNMIFPAAAANRAELEKEHPPAEAQAAPGATILLVEDSEDVRVLAEAVLGSLGYRVIAASGGEDALAKLASEPDVDLLFTDVIMPGGMNGVQLAERVRELRPGLPVLLATGYMDELPGRDQWQGDVLAKPYRQADLAERVRAALAQAQAQGR
ncbi:histidine kinase famiy protein [Pseudoduganella sp. GCM10020061]|uniref:histidine kinase famiy protein n=1 Tax=Pseudoduganella sp. GCM10020061 TaxID=3317345 RepID=UPI003634D2D6